MSHTDFTRRTALRTIGSLAAFGAVGTTTVSGRDGNANGDDVDTLRVFSERSVPFVARDVHVQDNLAFVANGVNVQVFDFRNPTRPTLVTTIDVPGVGVDDVKMDGDLLAASSQFADDPADIGTHFFDISDPSDPQYLSTFQVLPAGVHNHYLDDGTAYLCKEFPFDDSSLVVVGVTDPTDPTELTRWRVEDVHPELDQPTNFAHDVEVQDDLAYVAYWDAGTRVLDVSDPSDPVEVSAFGEAPDATEPAPGELDFVNPTSEFSQRVLGPPGNAHLSRPSPDGDYVYVNAETYLPDQPGPVTVFDVSDLSNPVKVATIEAPDVEVNPPFTLRTSHNFDVTRNRLYTTWYDGGVRVFDVTDPSTPEELSSFFVDGFTFDTATWARSFVLASVRGVGVLWLHDDRGRPRPTIGGTADAPRDIVRGGRN